MKLLTKSSLYFVVTSIVVFILSGVTIYFMLQSIILEEIDDLLTEQKEDVLWELHQLKGFENITIPKDSLVVIEPLKKPGTVKTVFKDTLLLNLDEYELEPFRYIRFKATYKGDARLVTIYKSMIESDDLIEGIIYSLFIIIVFTLFAIIILNYFGMRGLWQPFHNILAQIKSFDFKKSGGFETVETETSEFKDLNKELVEMTNKLTRDYFALKEFSENASHEMQTPLAIIQSKLELIFQQKDINEENLKSLNSAYKAANRLSRLHSELNLLTRIENQEFKKDETLSLKKIILEQVENFEDIISLKGIKLQTSYNADPQIAGNAYLLETLLSNLFSNAIKHNTNDGKISLVLNKNSFEISNSGPEPAMPTEILFERFRKGKPGQDSTGLGLALAKQICSVHEFEINYIYLNKLHTIKLGFKKTGGWNENTHYNQ
ncbi:MAG: sensor histidine kinase [Calditrichaeota bacterium]|nr:MAG: sensor histidine kinase [Calditrichota bacterium]MBL1205828.1 sensor histidine kinase [Calditrichota bacterium]NOG45655.1 HAMP domain-containing histidine kinase [Calditrichota bacterium]